MGYYLTRKDNMLMANGSSKKSRSINFVDQVVEPFLKIPPSKDKYKVVFMDEADQLTDLNHSKRSEELLKIS
jgi:DNA polymerase III delta prime subunit